MAINTDLSGIKYSGISKKGTFSTQYPLASYFLGGTLSNFESALSALFSSLSYKNYGIISQATLDTNTFYTNAFQSTILFSFAFDTDTTSGINKRFQVKSIRTWANSQTAEIIISRYKDNGTLDFETQFSTEVFHIANTTHHTPVQMVVTADDYSLGLFFTTTNLNTLATYSFFIGFCELQNINPNFGFYNNIYSDRYISMHSVNNGAIITKYRLYEFIKTAHTGSKAEFPIVCADAQKPIPNWATNYLVFDENEIFNHPLIGISSPVFSLGYGNFDLGKNSLVEFNSGIMADASSSAFMPIGPIANKTLMMRVWNE